MIHRDVEARNALLDGELNGRLEDFGLARLYNHGTLPRITNVVTSLGYLAPEHNIGQGRPQRALCICFSGLFASGCLWKKANRTLSSTSRDGYIG